MWMASAWHLCLRPNPWGCTTVSTLFSHAAAKAFEKSKAGLETHSEVTPLRRPPPPDLALEPACWRDGDKEQWDWKQSRQSFAWGAGSGRLSRGKTPGGSPNAHTNTAVQTCTHAQTCITHKYTLTNTPHKTIHVHVNRHVCIQHAHTTHMQTLAYVHTLSPTTALGASCHHRKDAVTAANGSRGWTRAGMGTHHPRAP